MRRVLQLSASRPVRPDVDHRDSSPGDDGPPLEDTARAAPIVGSFKRVLGRLVERNTPTSLMEGVSADDELDGLDLEAGMTGLRDKGEHRRLDPTLGALELEGQIVRCVRQPRSTNPKNGKTDTSPLAQRPTNSPSSVEGDSLSPVSINSKP
jgi:hypothetical protein